MAGLEATQPALTTVKSSTPTFTNIAPELRNLIYELVIDSFDTNAQTDLLEATTPSQALLLTCRQVYEEMLYVYRAAYRKFWTESNFALHMPPEHAASRETIRALQAIKDEDIAHIGSLTLVLETASVRRDPDGFWYETAPITETWGDFVIPPEKAQEFLLHGFPGLASVSCNGLDEKYVWIASKGTKAARVEKLRAFANSPPLTKVEILVMAYIKNL